MAYESDPFISKMVHRQTERFQPAEMWRIQQELEVRRRKRVGGKVKIMNQRESPASCNTTDITARSLQFQFEYRCSAEHRHTGGTKCCGSHLNCFQHAAPKNTAGNSSCCRPNPLLLVFVEQLCFTLFQVLPSAITTHAPSQLDLHPNELRPLAFAVLLQPVGVDQARSVIVGVFADRLDKCGFVGHGLKRHHKDHKGHKEEHEPISFDFFVLFVPFVVNSCTVKQGPRSPRCRTHPSV